MRIEVTNRQRKVAFSLKKVREFAAEARKAAEAFSANGEFALKQIVLVEVAVVSDVAIGKVHAEFLNDPSPTDVITFPYGEVVISAETAKREAKAHGHTVEEELGLYIVHGLLHLNGYNDHTPEEHRVMHAVQNRIWEKLR